MSLHMISRVGLTVFLALYVWDALARSDVPTPPEASP